MLIQSAAPQFILVNINHVRFGFYTYKQQILKKWAKMILCTYKYVRGLERRFACQRGFDPL